METALIAIVKQLLTIALSLSATVGALQADVNALKANANSRVLGAVASLTSPLVVDGSENYSTRVTVRSANSSVATFRVAATSTPEVIRCDIQNGANAATYVIGWGATAGATTTIITSRDVAASASFSIAATSTLQSFNALGVTDGTLPPGFVSVRTTRGDNTMTGTCTFKAVR